VPDLPTPTRLATPPGTVLVLRGDAAPWDGNAEGLTAALEHLHTETGCPVVFIDSAADDHLELYASLPDQAEAALGEAMGDLAARDAAVVELSAADLLERLRAEGWQLVRTRP
jgi:hypothetical protein